jgi:dephospho-CoA kinase
MKALEELGAATLSTDAVVHELLKTDELRDLLVDRFGPEVAPAGSVNRSRVAALAFEDPEQRGWLEGELWPRVGRRVAEWKAAVDEVDPPPRVVVVEVPLLFESGMDAVFDHTLAVVADEQVRSRRAGERGHAALESRTGRQLTQDEKADRADFVVRNDGTLEELKDELARFLATIRGK